jgi:hypothetical protein
LDTFTEQDGDCRFIHIEQDGANSRERLQMESKAFTHQRAIVCRGTSCYITKGPRNDGNYVTKFSWTSDRRRPEADLLKLARSRGVEGVAKLICHCIITSIDEIRPGLTFTKPYSFRGHPGTSFSQRLSRKRKLVDVSQKSNMAKQESRLACAEDTQKTSLFASNSEGTFDNRIFRCLVVSPAGRAIHDFDRNVPSLPAIKELLEALHDAIKAHRSLYLVGHILHRDISENNIIKTDPEKADGFKGMLIDLDLAKEVDIGRSGVPF